MRIAAVTALTVLVATGSAFAQDEAAAKMKMETRSRACPSRCP